MLKLPLLFGRRWHGLVLFISACRTCSTLIFTRSTNQILNLWRCCCRCRSRHWCQGPLIIHLTNFSRLCLFPAWILFLCCQGSRRGKCGVEIKGLLGERWKDYKFLNFFLLKKMVWTQEWHTLIEKDHLGEWNPETVFGDWRFDDPCGGHLRSQVMV